MLPGNFWYLSICLECYCQLSHWGEEWHHMYKIGSRFQNAIGPHHEFALMGRSHGPERWWMWAVNYFSLNCLLHFVYCALLIKPSWSNLHKKGNWVSIYPRCYDTTAGFDTTYCGPMSLHPVFFELATSSNKAFQIKIVWWYVGDKLCHWFSAFMLLAIPFPSIFIYVVESIVEVGALWRRSTSGKVWVAIVRI